MPLNNLKATGSGRFFNINHLYNDDTQKKIKIMDVGAVLIQLKPLHMQQVHDWQRTLKARQDEVIETLKAELDANDRDEVIQDRDYSLNNDILSQLNPSLN